MKFYPFEGVPNWGVSQRVAVIVVTENEAIVKHYIETNETRTVQTLLECYTNLIAGKTVTEIQTITSGYVQRFDNLFKTKSRFATVFKKENN